MKKPRPFKIIINGLTQYLHCDKVDNKEFMRLYEWMHKAFQYRVDIGTKKVIKKIDAEANAKKAAKQIKKLIDKVKKK